jgi:hypothetical protein
MNGAPIPESKEDPLWQKMSYKDKQEDIMQIIIDEQIKNLNLVKKFGDMFLDALITGKCFCKIEIDEKGDVDIIQIDPRNFIYEEIDKDDFIKKSPIIGARTTMPLYEILRRYELTKEQRDLLNAIQANPDGYISRSRNMLRKTSSGVVADVIHIEWKASRPRYYMVSPKTPNQLAFDSENTEITKELFDYEKHQEHYDNGHTNGKWRIESKWEEDLWEATRIGGIKELDLNMRRKPFQFRRHDAPAYILDSSYMGCLFNTVNGTRVPLQQYIENLDQQFDIVMYQILKELNRAKGKILAFDMAAAPKGVTAKKIVYDALNDGFVMLNTAAAHNFSGRNLDLKQLIQQEDLGLSDSFPALIQLKQDILNNLDRLTGINEFREGASPASSTVTNAQQSVQNSRTITEPIFFMMQLFVERCMQTLVEATDKYQFMKVTPDLGLRDYGIHIEDGGRYAELKNYMNGLIQYGLNGKDITMFDALKFYMAPTFVEAEQAFYNAVERTQKAAQEQMAAQQQFDAQMQQQQLQQQLQIAQEDREDRQAADTQNIITKGQVQMEVDNNKAQNKTIELHQKSQSDLLNNIE